MNVREELAVKQARVAEFLDRENLDGVLLSRRANFSWFSAGAYNHVNAATEVGAATLLVTRSGATVFTTNIEAERLIGEGLAGRQMDVVPYPWHSDASRASAILQAARGLSLAADEPITGVPANPLPGSFAPLRWTLLESEIERYRSMATDVARAVEAVAAAIEPGATEVEVAGRMQAEMFARNCLPWVTLVAGEDRVMRYRHPLPTAAPVNRYAMLVACGERAGLVASCTRFYHFGPVPADLRRKAEASATVDATMIDATRPGKTLGDVLAAGIAAYKAQGFAGEWELHHQGGSAGYLPREVIATPGCAVPVLADQAFAWNPSITGTKSEDTILCRAAGPEILAEPGDWPMIEVSVEGRTYRRPAILER